MLEAAAASSVGGRAGGSGRATIDGRDNQSLPVGGITEGYSLERNIVVIVVNSG